MEKTAYEQGIEYALQQLGLLKKAGMVGSAFKGIGKGMQWLGGHASTVAKPAVNAAKAPGAVSQWSSRFGKNLTSAGEGLAGAEPWKVVGGGAKNYAKGLVGYGTGLGSTLGKGTTIGAAGYSVGNGLFGNKPPPQYGGYGN